MSDEEKVIQIQRMLNSLVELLNSFPAESLARAMCDTSTQKIVEDSIQKRKEWSKVMNEIADDFERSVRILDQSKVAIRKMGDTINNMEHFERFLKLCEQLQKYNESGLLDKVVSMGKTL